MNGKCVRHLNVLIVEHIRISPLINRQVKPKNSSVVNYLLFYKHLASYDVSILISPNKKFL